MRKIFLLTAVAFACMMHAEKAALNTTATFENAEGGINLITPESVWQGADNPQIGANKWQSGAFTFTTSVADWGGGYLGYMATTVSNETSNAFTGYEYYRSAKGGAYEGANFAVWTDAYSADVDVECAAQVVPGFFINNTAYAVNSMCNGDAYAKKFTKDDNFTLTIKGFKGGAEQGQVVFYLAKDGKYVNEWTYVDLSSLGEVDALKFQMWGTDIVTYDGETYYLNTPAYFCMDNFGAEKPEGYVEPERAKFPQPATFENEPGGINLITPESVWQGADNPQIGANKWKSGDFTFTTIVADWGGGYLGYMATTVSNETSNAFTGYEYYRNAKGGAYEGANFAVWTDAYSADADVVFAAQVVPGFFINNTAYAVHSMCNGDAYAKKFTADDNFTLTIKGFKGGAEQGQVVFYLAKDGKYVNEWTYVDLSSLGEVDALKFQMWGTDIVTYDGETYYLNTPAYFCMDNFGAEKPEGYVEPERAKFDIEEGIKNVETGAKAFKVLRNGQLIIVRGEAEFTVTGQSIK